MTPFEKEFQMNQKRFASYMKKQLNPNAAGASLAPVATKALLVSLHAHPVGWAILGGVAVAAGVAYWLNKN